jgi:hypothetical protein
MPTRAFTSLENKIAANVPGCPRPTIEQFVRDIAIEVCEKTLAWRFEHTPLALTDGVYSYDYGVPSGSEVVAVIHAALMSGDEFLNSLSPLVQEDIHRLYPDWPSPDVTKRSPPRYIGQITTDQFVVVPVPDDTKVYTVKMFLALRPTLDAAGMDQVVFNECEQLILHGVLQHLHVLPDKSWTDYNLASYHAKQYTYKTALRRAKVNLGVARAPLSARMRPLE